MRFTMARANQGFSGAVIQAASFSRMSSSGPLRFDAPVEILRLARAFWSWDDHLARGLQHDLAFVVLVRVLHAHAAEKRGEAPEIVLGPFLPRVVVAARAFDAHAQKHLADIGGDIFRLGKFGDVVEIRSRIEIELPEAVISSVANWLYGLSSSIDFRSQLYMSRPPFGRWSSRPTRNRSVKRVAQISANSGRAINWSISLARFWGSAESRKAPAFIQRGQQPDRIQIDAPQKLVVGRAAKARYSAASLEKTGLRR